MNAPYPQFRPYPRDSAEAAARIVALALIANGRIKAVETAALDARQAPERLGLTRPQWHGVIHDLCSDLLGPARCGDEGCIPSELLAAIERWGLHPDDQALLEPMLNSTDFQSARRRRRSRAQAAPSLRSLHPRTNP